MNISAKDWKAFVHKLSAINTTAADAVRDYVLKNGFDDMDSLIQFCYQVAEKYGTASTSLAALMYDTVADLEGVVLPNADLVPAPTQGDVAKAVNGTLKTSYNPESVSGAVARIVKKMGQDTFLQNARRDHAEFAWIPNGDTCPFCIMLASRGWERINHSNGAPHIHAHCDCTYMVRHTSDFNVEGYDPDEYYRQYKEADGKTWKDKINSMRRENYEENASEIRMQKREAYALREELKKNNKIE